MTEHEYRYTLRRDLGHDRTMAFVMLNPSTADDVTDDPTVKRCIGFADREGCNLRVVNLWPYRATDPDDLARWLKSVSKNTYTMHDRLNRDHVTSAFRTADLAVLAWGAKVDSLPTDKAHRAVAAVAQAAHQQFGHHLDEVTTLGRTKSGAPKHPLYLRKDTPLQAWKSQG